MFGNKYLFSLQFHTGSVLWLQPIEPQEVFLPLFKGISVYHGKAFVTCKRILMMANLVKVLL